MSTATSRHVAIIAFPLASHPANLFSFSRAMAAAAPDVTFSFFVPPFAAAKLLPSPPEDNLHVRHVSDGHPEEGAGPDANIVPSIDHMFLKAAPGNFVAALRAAEEEVGTKVGCVVSNALMWMAEDVAEEIGAKWVPLWMASPAALLAQVFADQIRERFGEEKQAMPPGWEDEVIDFIPGLSSIHVSDLPMNILTDLHSPMSVLFHEAGNRITRAAAVVLNTFRGLDSAIDASLASTFKSTLAVGPLNLLSPLPPPHPRDQHCLSWLDTHHDPASVAYVSFGMMPPAMIRTQVAEVARGVESSGVGFLWSLPDEGMLPPGFSERTAGRGLVVPWAPQVRVLGHRAVGAFVTPCGWNGVMESVTSGVPMVCVPIVTDQKINARVASEVWHVGEAVLGKTVTGEEVARCVEVVMGAEEGRRMRERIGKLRDKSVESVGPGGTSSENFKSLLELICGHAADV